MNINEVLRTLECRQTYRHCCKRVGRGMGRQTSYKVRKGQTESLQCQHHPQVTCIEEWHVADVVTKDQGGWSTWGVRGEKFWISGWCRITLTPENHSYSLYTVTEYSYFSSQSRPIILIL